MAEVEVDEAWSRYGAALIGAMREVLDEVDDSHRELILEVADFWLALGVVIGLERPEQARRLIEVVESDAGDREELHADADDLLDAALA
jgi:hypothetical protein